MGSWQTRFLPHGLFPQLGERFLRRWHASYFNAPHGVALIVEQDVSGRRKPVGFLIGSTDQTRHIEDVINRHRTGLIIAGLAGLARRPRLAAYFLRTRGRAYLRRLLGRAGTGARSQAVDAGREGGSALGHPRTAVITALAVGPETRGSGAGRELVSAFLARTRAAGAPTAELVVLSGPGSATAFYERLGWQHVEEHLTRDGTPARTYRYDLRTEEPRKWFSPESF